MRRKDRAITDRPLQDALIAKARVLHMALVDNGKPYCVPMNFGYDGKAVYMHSATTGKKLDCIATNPAVALNLIITPQLTPLEHATKACDLSMLYGSVTIMGQACIVTNSADRRHGWQTILRQFSCEHLPFEDSQKVLIVRVDIDTITAKSHR